VTADRVIAVGEVIFVEDVIGKGHLSRSSSSALSVFSREPMLLKLELAASRSS
jgi:hypothetical protein